jgi:hypothetical protein
MFTLGNGNMFSTSLQHSYCLSGWTLKPDVDKDEYYCMPADKSVNDPTANSFNTTGADCNYNKWTNVSAPAEMDTVTGTNPSLCGFNTDENSWCPQLRGDKQYTTLVSEWTTLQGNTNSNTACQSASRGVDDSGQGVNGCYALNEKNKDMWKQMAQGDWVVADNQGWPNVAMNDGCVKSTITQNYYFADSSSLLVTGFIGVLAMCYIF